MAFNTGRAHNLLKYEAFVGYVYNSITSCTAILPKGKNDYLHDKHPL